MWALLIQLEVYRIVTPSQIHVYPESKIVTFFLEIELLQI